MSKQTWQETLKTSIVDGTALANSTTITSIIPVGALCVLPAASLEIGRMFKVTAQGRISTLATTPGTLDFDIRFGSVSVAASGNLALNTNAKTNVSWWLEWLLTCRAIGSGTSANFMHVGTFQSEAVIGAPLPSAGGNGSLLFPAATMAVGTGFDSTAAQLIDFRAHWSTANAANSIQVHMYKVELLN